jgi:hypothetical protein
MDLKKAFFSVVVILIVVAFFFSFFSMAATSSNKDEPEEQPQDVKDDITPKVEQVTQTDEPSNFMVSIKQSMVVGDSDKDTAQTIANTINMYNSLSDGKKVVSFDGTADDYKAITQSLKGMDIYFDAITSEQEKAAFALIQVDDDGIAYLQ